MASRVEPEPHPIFWWGSRDKSQAAISLSDVCVTMKIRRTSAWGEIQREARQQTSPMANEV